MTGTDETRASLQIICKLLRIVPHGRYGKAIESELQAAYSAGYAAGHKDQMRARILDAQERRNGK